MNFPTYILRGLDQNGETFYYTGRAGEGWLTRDTREAFTYTSQAMARSRAQNFNRHEALHGMWFIPMPAGAVQEVR